jgi:citrate lyase subunit beta-like protein
MHSRRAMLYVPGDDERKIQKAAGLPVDSICMDLEDGVALNRKDAAREVISAALRSLDFGGSERLVRINPLSSERGKPDLEAVLPVHPDGIVLPKVQSPDELVWMDEQLSQVELEEGWQAGSLAMLAIIERARAFLDLKEICAAVPRLQGLIFGAEDYADDVGAIRTAQGHELSTARSLLVMHAAAFGLQAIDMVTVDFRDIDLIAREARAGAELGYTGKQIIHPNQIEPVQAAFTPSQAEIERAESLLQMFEQHQQRGAGAFAVDGQMVDMPVIRQARNLLARAQAAGKI